MQNVDYPSFFKVKMPLFYCLMFMQVVDDVFIEVLMSANLE